MAGAVLRRKRTSYQSLPPHVPVKVQSETQFLKEYSGSKGTDSFVGIFDALTLQSTASIVQLKARGSELCTNVAVSTRLVYDGGEVNRHGFQQTRHRPRNNFPPSIRHVAPHQQSKVSVRSLAHFISDRGENKSVERTSA
jgi:hypothetical protein